MAAKTKTATKGRATAPAAKAREVATRKSTTVASPEAAAAAMYEDAESGADHGFETRDFAVPFITILQDLSPQVKKKDEAYIEGAEVGMIFDSSTGEVIPGDEGIYFIPVKYMRRWVGWKLPRGEGMFKDYGSDESVMAETEKDGDGRNILKSNKKVQIVESGDYFGYIVDPEGKKTPRQVIISMSSSKWRPAKKLNALIANWREETPDGKGTFNPKMYARCYHFTTVPDSNGENDYFNWSIAPGDKTFDLPDGASLYASAKGFLESIDAGLVKIAAPSDEGSGGKGGSNFDN